MVHGADSVERFHRDQPSERETGNTYEKSFEIRFDEIDFIGHLHNTRYLEYCSHTRYCHFVEQGRDLRRMGRARYWRGVADRGDPLPARGTAGRPDHRHVPDHRLQRGRQALAQPRPDAAPRRCGRSDGDDHGAWFGLRSRRMEAPPPELLSVTDSIKS